MERMTLFMKDEMPEWMWKIIPKYCPNCGAPLFQNELFTSRWCGNPKCIGHLSYRLVEVANFFGKKGIGPATAETVIRTYKLSNVFEVIPYWFPAQKPLVSLSDIAVIACIEGYGKTQADKELLCYATFEDYFQNAVVNPLLLKHKDTLIDAQKYFRIKPPLSARQMFVMGTGSFHGYSSREEYFNLVNAIFGQYVNVIQTGKRKTGITCLIKEQDAVDHSKSQIAAANNIPIVTPMQFIALLCHTFHISIEDINKSIERTTQ